MIEAHPVSTSAITTPVLPVVIFQADTASVAREILGRDALDRHRGARRVEIPLTARPRGGRKERIVRDRDRIAPPIDGSESDGRVGSKLIQHVEASAPYKVFVR